MNMDVTFKVVVIKKKKGKRKKKKGKCDQKECIYERDREVKR